MYNKMTTAELKAAAIKNVSEATDKFVIKHKKTKQVLSTHDEYDSAKDEHNGLGNDKSQYGIYKQTKKDSALRHRNQGTAMKEYASTKNFFEFREHMLNKLKIASKRGK